MKCCIRLEWPDRNPVKIPKRFENTTEAEKYWAEYKDGFTPGAKATIHECNQCTLRGHCSFYWGLYKPEKGEEE